MAVSNSKSVSFSFLKNPLSENKMEEKGKKKVSGTSWKNTNDIKGLQSKLVKNRAKFYPKIYLSPIITYLVLNRDSRLKTYSGFIFPFFYLTIK